MKTTLKVTVIAIFFFAPAALSAQQKHTQEAHAKHTEAAKSAFVCPMDCEKGKQYDKPGNCPKCGMPLKKQALKEEASGSKEAVWTCPMHPEVTSDHAGDCPKCGMKLSMKDMEGHDKMDMHTYTCPMHPEVQSDKPGTCDKCGMQLVQDKKDAKK